MPDYGLFPITAVSTVTDKFTVAGNHVAQFPVGQFFTVDGSTGNDGTYQVISVALVTTNTVIGVAVVPDATADGTVYLPGQLITTLNDQLVTFYGEATINDGIVATLAGATVNDSLQTYDPTEPVNDALETEFGPGQINDAWLAGTT